MPGQRGDGSLRVKKHHTEHHWVEVDVAKGKPSREGGAFDPGEGSLNQQYHCHQEMARDSNPWVPPAIYRARITGVGLAGLATQPPVTGVLTSPQVTLTVQKFENRLNSAICTPFSVHDLLLKSYGL